MSTPPSRSAWWVKNFEVLRSGIIGMRKSIVIRLRPCARHAYTPLSSPMKPPVQAVSAWSVKTRFSPSRHCTDARVHGHTTMAMHDIEYPPTPQHCRDARVHGHTTPAMHNIEDTPPPGGGGVRLICISPLFLAVVVTVWVISTLWPTQSSPPHYSIERQHI